MKIGPVDSGGRPERPQNETQRRDKAGSEQNRRQNRSDSIDISKSARELSEYAESNKSANRDVPQPAPADLPEQLSAYTEEIEESQVREEKVEQAKQRVESGYYDSARVKEEIAKRITDDVFGE
ncbi:MAG: hypothetical protein V3V99_00435 [candidate division Zixibacteria bacterium]